ncbi:DUF305 domain-containing protein [Salinispora mooreana]|uniref:DUF305 domain-containing protein n=1 Tax=Salinispora mooreana TaxID=999545 RepID=UPI00035F75CC|nr:DUF305 domain-containing protein [Salinispora mooreana]
MSVRTPLEEKPDGAPPAASARRPATRFGTATMAIAIVIGLLLGYAGGLLTPNLNRPGDTSAEAGFARDMTTHHAQAVEMGLIAFKHGTDREVQTIGSDIALGQQGDIGIMQAWLRSWELDPTGSEPRMAWVPDGTEMIRDGLMPGMATAEQMTQLREARGTEVDVLFLELMITHHIGGIHMVDALLDQSDEKDVVQTAQTMKNTQQTDLTNLRNALERIRG